jgi:hypothetical protein
MLQADFAESVAKKRKAIRLEIAKLATQIIPDSFTYDLALFHCGKCSLYYNRHRLRFDYRSNGFAETYEASETCTKCKRVCAMVPVIDFDHLDPETVQKLSCPSCKRQEFELSELLTWD